MRRDASGWTFITNHGHVLASIVSHPNSTIREIAREVGITERATQKIIRALEADGYIARHRQGRCNSYTVNADLPLRHHMEWQRAVRDLLLALGCQLPPHTHELRSIDRKPPEKVS
ncbi:MAG: winged helix-turn-helix domain-containing protein [Chloroflexi bacterium]|nr:winged helix-turn-helix domain-containing protein [Chloroflexota bacterium]